MASTKEAKTVARIPSKRTDVKPVRSADAQVPLDVCDDELDVVADGQPGRMGKVDVGVHATRSVHASESVVAAARASGSGATDARDADAMDHRSDDVLAGTRMPPRHDEYLAQATGLREFGATGGHLDSMDAKADGLVLHTTAMLQIDGVPPTLVAEPSTARHGADMLGSSPLGWSLLGLTGAAAALTGGGSNGSPAGIVASSPAPADVSPPSVSGIALSADSGVSATDFVTNVAVQTVSATLSAPLAAGETLWGSTDGGRTWVDLVGKVNGTSVNWSGAVLSDTSGSSIQFKVVDTAGKAGAVTVQGYVLDTVAPVAMVGHVHISSDTGVDDSDFVTSAASQTITATLSSPLNPDETVWGSTDNGEHFTPVTRVSGTELTWDGAVLVSGAQAIVFKTVDAAGNETRSGYQAYSLLADPVRASEGAGTEIGSSRKTGTSEEATVGGGSGGGGSGGADSPVSVTRVATPIIARVTGDDRISAAESQGFVISGVAEALASVAVTFGDVRRLAQADANGHWSVRLDQVPVDGPATISAIASIGTTNSAAATRDVVVDTVAPAALSIHHSTGAAASAAAISVSGIEDGATVSYSVDGGAYSAAYVPPLTPLLHKVTVTQTDAAGNVSAPASTPLLLFGGSVSRRAELLSHRSTGDSGNSLAFMGYTLSNFDAPGYALFKASDASQFGNPDGTRFTDAGLATWDIILSNPDGQLALVTHAPGDANRSAGIGTVLDWQTAPVVFGHHVIFSSPNAALLGNSTAFTDANPAGLDYFSYDVRNGQTALITHDDASRTDSSYAGVLSGRMGSGRYLAYSATAISGLGDANGAFSNADRSAADIVVFDVESGALQLVTHNTTASNLSSSVSSTAPPTLRAVTDHYVIFSAADVGTFGTAEGYFKDSSIYSNDLIAYDVYTGELRLINHGPQLGALSTSVDTTISYQGALNDHVYFSARDATTFGNNGVAFRDTDPDGPDLYAYDLHNGIINLVTHTTDLGTSAGRGSAYDVVGMAGDDLFFRENRMNTGLGNADGQIFTDLSSPVGGSDAAWNIYAHNNQTQALALVTHSASSAFTSATAPGDQSVGFLGVSDDNAYVIFKAADASDFGNGVPGAGTAAFTDANALQDDLLAYRLSDGAQQLITHDFSAGAGTAAASPATFKAIAGQFVIFQAADATAYGNDGVAFADAKKSAADLFSYNLNTGKTDLITSQPGSNTGAGGSAAKYLATDGQHVIFSAYDAAQYGFTDADPASADVFSYNLATHALQLLNFAPDRQTTTAGKVTFNHSDGQYAYFTTDSATPLGFNDAMTGYQSPALGALGPGYTDQFRVLLT